MAYAEEEREEGEEELETPVDGEHRVAQKAVPEWEHKVSLGTLLKLGLTSNYLRGVGIIVAFYFTLREQFMFNETLSAQLQEPEMFWTQGKYMFIIFLLAIGMLLTVGETVVKYFGLHLQKYRDTLQVEMGLRNNTKVNIRASRIQLLQILTNPIQKKMNLYQAKISLASSENDLEKNQIRIVGLPPAVVNQVKEYFYESTIEEVFKVLPSKFLLWRKISRGMLPLIIVAGILFIYFDALAISWFVVIAAFYVVLLTLYNYLYFKNLTLGVSKDFLVKHSGVWLRKEEYLEMFRLQAVSVSQPIWYRRRGLVNLTFHSAGGDVSFPMVYKSNVQPLINYLLFKIQSTERSWM
jgi:putative membrane protein